jgi:MarR family transcriptional regulator, transcriptional regulator for hemolysin
MTTDPFLTRALGFLLADVSRLMRRRFDARAREIGLTRAQWRVLAQLRRREGINQTALAEIMEIEPISLGRHIDRLVEKDIVERRPDPRDRRAWRLYLKPEAQPVLDRLRAISNANRKEVLRGIPPEESEALIDTLLKIKSNLTALEAAEPSGPKSGDEARSSDKSSEDD